jgi:hypothetical protein
MDTIFWVENLNGRDQLEDLGIDEKIALEWNLGRLDMRVWTGFIWLRIATSGSPL